MKYAVLIFCLLFVLPVEGQIKGRILSEDKQPIQYVNIISIVSVSSRQNYISLQSGPPEK